MFASPAFISGVGTSPASTDCISNLLLGLYNLGIELPLHFFPLSFLLAFGIQV